MSLSVEDVAMTQIATDKDVCFEQLMNPAIAYKTPMDVVRDCDLTTNEKRALLASWASDAYAVAASPGLRQLPDSSPIPIDDILTALKQLDGDALERPEYCKLVDRAHRIKSLFRPNNQGRSLLSS